MSDTFEINKARLEFDLIVSKLEFIAATKNMSMSDILKEFHKQEGWWKKKGHNYSISNNIEETNPVCPYCGTDNYLPNNVELNVRFYGSSFCNFRCNICKEVIGGYGQRDVTFSNLRKTDEPSDW